MLLCKDQEPLAVLQGFAVKKCLDEQRICHSLMLDLENHSVAPSNATRFFMSLMHPDPAERQGLEMKDSPYLAAQAQHMQMQQGRPGDCCNRLA